MRKIYILGLLVCSVNLVFSQSLLRESFIYPAGSVVTNSSGVWLENTSGGATNPIQVDAASLTYPNAASFGGKVLLAGSGQDIVAALSSVVNSGTVYYTCLVNIATATATGDYFLHFSQTTTTNNYFGRVFVKSATGGINFGLMKTSGGTTPYGTSVFSVNTTYCLVLKYTFNTASTTDDEVKLFVFPAATGLPSTEPGTSELAVTTNSDATSLGAVAIRQAAASTACTGSVDNINVSTTWSELAATLPVQIQSFSGNSRQGKALLQWQVANETNFSHYTVEKSINGTQFSSVGTVKALGTTSYEFTDATLKASQYYRLKLVDKDGSFRYSSVVLVRGNAGNTSLQIVPNPVANEAVLQHSIAKKGDRVNIVAANGSVVKSVVVAENAEQTKLTVQGLSSGRYQVVYLAADGTQKATSLLKQ